jgi:hypothetical protein
MWKTIPRQPSETSSCEKSIKQNARLAVKFTRTAAAFLSLVCLSCLNARSEEPPPPPPPVPIPQDISPEATADSSSDPESLPDIEAKIRHLKVLKASTSRRVYLMDIPITPDPNAQAAETGEKPSERKLLLIREGEENIMALRVLRDIHGTSQVIAKKIKQYANYEALDIGREYYALEKLSDIIPPPPTPQDQADMAEVEPPPLAFDPDLDTGSSPPPGSYDDSALDSRRDREERLGASIEEKNIRFEKQRNWIAVGFGLVRNTPDEDPTAAKFYTGAGIRYGVDLIHRLFVTRDERIDTLTFEGSLFYYSISGLNASEGATALDTYNIAPVIGTARYTYYYNEDFGLFFYGGLMKNFITSSENANEDRVLNLSRSTTIGGVGALLRVGPQWYTRVDAGLDMISANLMIRF